jgi:hypothetical protein
MALASGVSLVGKQAQIPARAQVGRNCIIYPEIKEGDWKESSDLNKIWPLSMFHNPRGDQSSFRAFILADEKSCATGADWSLAALQTCGLESPKNTVMGEEWYNRKVGVHLTMLGEAGTTAYTAAPDLPPEPENPRIEQPKEQPKYAVPKRDKKYDADDEGFSAIPPPEGRKEELPPPKPVVPREVRERAARARRMGEFGLTTIVAARHTPATVFIALHEPFEGGAWKIEQFRRIQQTEQGLALAVVGKEGSAINDRILLRVGDDPDRPVTLAGDGESFTFADRGFVRVRPDKVEVSGPVKALKVKVSGQPKLVVNGKDEPASLADGCLTFGAP